MDKHLQDLQLKALAMDARLIQAQKDQEYLEEFLERFKAIRANMRELENYYFYQGTWAAQRDELTEHCPDFNAAVLSEDGIYNAHVEQYDTIKQILKQAALAISE